jgi:hypothetical protein
MASVMTTSSETTEGLAQGRIRSEEDGWRRTKAVRQEYIHQADARQNLKLIS